MKKQFSALLLSRGLSSLIQAVSLLLFVRWAGVEAFGLIAIITSVAAVLYTLSDWGAGIHIPRSRAKELDELVAGGLAVSIIGNTIAAALLTSAVLAAVIWGGVNVWLVLIPLALALEQCTEAGLTVSVADRIKRVVFISLLIRRLVMLVLFVGLYWLTGNPLLAYGVAALASAVSGTVHAGLDLRRRLHGLARVQVRLQLWREFSPFVLENVSSSTRNLDTTIVAALTSVQATGFYSAAFRLTKPMNQIGGAATAVLVPHASRSSLVDVKRAAMKLSIAGGMGILIAIMGGLFSEPVLVLLLGDEFVVAGPVFAWALISIVPVCLAPSLGGLLQGQGYQKFVAMNGMVFAFVTLAGIFWATIIYGIAGAAAALAVSYFLKSLVLALRIVRLRVDSVSVTAADGRDVDSCQDELRTSP